MVIFTYGGNYEKMATVENTGTGYYVCGETRTLSSKTFNVKCDGLLSQVTVRKDIGNLARILGVDFCNIADIDSLIAVLKETKKLLKTKIKEE